MMRESWFLSGDLFSLQLILSGFLKFIRQGKRWQDYKKGRCGFRYSPEYMELILKWFEESVFSIQDKEIRCAVTNYFITHVLSLESSILFFETLKNDKKNGKKNMECLEDMAKISSELGKKLVYYRQMGDEKKKLLTAGKIKTVGDLKLLVKKQEKLDEEYVAELDSIRLPEEAIVRAELDKERDKIVFYREAGSGLCEEEIFEIPVSWLLK